MTISDSQITTKNSTAGVRAGRYGSGTIMMNSGTVSNSGRVWIGGDDDNHVGHADIGTT